MSENKKTPNSSDADFGKFFDGLGKVAIFISTVCFYGLKQIKPKTFNFWFYTGGLALTCYNFACQKFWHLVFLNKAWPSLFSDDLVIWLSKRDSLWHYMFLFISSSIAILCLLGLKEFFKVKKLKRAIDNLAFNTVTGMKPKIEKIEVLGSGKTKLTVSSGGQGISDFRSKTERLSASFGQIVDGIKVSQKDLSKVEIFLSERDLPYKFSFSSCKKFLKEPYTFIVGESHKGIIVQNIKDLPHMFICGTTDGGKSVFLHNVLLGLMNSSQRIKIYYLDLKSGLENQDYKDLPNVEVVKDEKAALVMMEDLIKLMDKRFDYLASKNLRKFDAERDKMDLIVVAFDEVSEIFDTSIKNKESKEIRLQICEHAHRLSKLSRAAGFHLIFATQKIKKDLLPTEIQTNIGGRMAFKLPTTADSVTAIGNKKAFELPGTKGRGIWAHGNDFTQVQGPFLSDYDIQSEIKGLRKKFEDILKNTERNELSSAETESKEEEDFDNAVIKDG